MKTMKEQMDTFSNRAGACGAWLRKHDAAANALKFCRRGLALSLVYLMIPMSMGNLYAFAQDAPPPPPDQDAPVDQGGAPPQQYSTLSPDQLNQLVAPIALYPDALVAQVLAASTFPNQIPDADQFTQQNAGVPPAQLAQMADGMQWDPSVKALTGFPSVLSNLNRNMDWTTQLGNAYYNQPQDVMSAVQAMRQQAYAAGHLQSGSQLAVTYAPGDIVIAPANPAVVYVPYYNPWVIYGGPVISPWYGYYVAPPPPGIAFGIGLGLGFGLGIAIGVWGHWGWGWNHWGVGWGNHAVFFNHTTYISRSVTVVNHGYYGRFDRNPEARSFNRNMAMHASNYNRTIVNNRTTNVYNHNTVNNNRTNTYNRGNTYNRPAQQNNFNRPAQNYSRPAQNYSRPAQNYSRPAQNNSRPAQNNSRPAGNAHPAARPSGGGHPESHSGGGHPSGHEGHR
jgi:hypothetical protein